MIFWKAFSLKAYNKNKLENGMHSMFWSLRDNEVSKITKKPASQ